MGNKCLCTSISMQNKTYPFVPLQGSRYTFTSIGKKRIVKQVIFTPTGNRGIFNLGFGDIMPDGSIDDKANSNNGDIVSVLATVVEILKDFTSKHPLAEVFFTGSTQERTRLYTRILKTYYGNFSKQFKVTGLIPERDHYILLPFEPKADLRFLGFIIQRIH